MKNHNSLRAYFEFCQSTVRLFDGVDTLVQLVGETTWEAVALRYIVMAHAVPTCPQFLTWAQTHLEVASGNDYAGHFVRLSQAALARCNPAPNLDKGSLRTLQATILLGLYELQHAQFGRAWLTAGRADWLTQSIGSRVLDSHDNARRTRDDVGIIDEARRAQWAASSLACMLMKGGRVVDPLNEVRPPTHNIASEDTDPHPPDIDMAAQLAGQ
jgi:hypothetical protein